jgi:hypothetical protein
MRYATLTSTKSRGYHVNHKVALIGVAAVALLSACNRGASTNNGAATNAAVTSNSAAPVAPTPAPAVQPTPDANAAAPSPGNGAKTEAETPPGEMGPDPDGAALPNGGKPQAPGDAGQSGGNAPDTGGKPQ